MTASKEVFFLPDGRFFQLIHLSDGLKRHQSVCVQVKQSDYSRPIRLESHIPFKRFRTPGYQEIVLAAETEHLEVITLREPACAFRDHVHVVSN